jgi:hypothetical protein
MIARRLAVVFVLLLCGCASAAAVEIIPPVNAVKPDHPRLLVRPNDTPFAISLKQLKATPRDKDVAYILKKLASRKSAMSQAMVWLMTGDDAAADKAIARMRAYDNPQGKGDAFTVYFRLREFALAYDWLYNHPKFTKAIKAEVRKKLAPLAATGMKISNDHVFHNYVWMSAGGTALWALATAGDDADADKLYAQIRDRLNTRLYPGWKYLDGMPGESMGYWSLYDLSPGVLALLAAQSASETDLMAVVKNDGDWLDRQYQYLIHITTPAMKYLTWGDSRWGQPDNGVTHQMAGVSDALAWALKSPTGAHFSQWMARGPRGMGRFYGETGAFYLLYTRRLKTEPVAPPLSYLAGTKQGGHFIARSSWAANATVVGFRCTDFFGNHNHFDQGSFMIYRGGLIATDPPFYPKVHGGQEKTKFHSTLLLGGKGQRRARGQSFRTLASFEKARKDGMLETGDILFYKEAGKWAAVAGQFAQAYPKGLVRSCVRQLLFVRPGTVVVVDHIVPVRGEPLPVDWVLQLPAKPSVKWGDLIVSNGKSWLRCQPVYPGPSIPKIDETPVKSHRARYRYEVRHPLSLVHVLTVGDGAKPGPAANATVKRMTAGVEVTLGKTTYTFANRRKFEVSSDR